MKIALLITRSELGGAQSHVLELLRGLRQYGHDPALAAGEEGWLTDQANSLGISTTIIGNLVNPVQPLRDVAALRQVKKWITALKPDVVHCHSSKAGLLGRIAAHSNRVPCLYTVHGWAFTGGSSWGRKLLSIPSEWIAARTRSEILCVSQYDTDLALQYRIAPRSQLHTVWNGIADMPQRAQPGSNSCPLITMIARFAPPKDQSTLLHALALLKGTEWRLRLVGDGPLLNDCKELARKLQLESRIDFLGARADIASLLSQSHIFVLATRFEALPISILEAMRAGLPVIASKVGGVSELVSSDTGIVVPASDAPALASAISGLLDSPDRRQSLGVAGRVKFEQTFSSDYMLEKTTAIYRRCFEKWRAK